MQELFRPGPCVLALRSGPQADGRLGPAEFWEEPTDFGGEPAGCQSGIELRTVHRDVYGPLSRGAGETRSRPLSQTHWQ